MLDLGIGPHGLSRALVQGDDAAFRAARHAQDLVAFDNHVFGQSPNPILGVEPGLEIDGPKLLARAGFVGGQAAQRAHLIEDACIIGGRGPRAGGRFLPGLAVGRFPQQLALHVQCQEQFRVAEVADREDLPLGDRYARVPVAAAGILPEQSRAARRPFLQQALFGRDVHAARAVEFRPDSIAAHLACQQLAGAQDHRGEDCPGHQAQEPFPFHHFFQTFPRMTPSITSLCAFGHDSRQTSMLTWIVALCNRVVTAGPGKFARREVERSSRPAARLRRDCA